MKTRRIFFQLSNTKIIMNGSAYRKIKRHIREGVVQRFRGAFILSLTCPLAALSAGDAVFYADGAVVASDSPCAVCVHRLRKLTGGTCNTRFRHLIPEKRAADLQDVIAALHRAARIDPSLAYRFADDWDEYLEDEGADLLDEPPLWTQWFIRFVLIPAAAVIYFFKWVFAYPRT